MMRSTIFARSSSSRSAWCWPTTTRWISPPTSRPTIWDHPYSYQCCGHRATSRTARIRRFTNSATACPQETACWDSIWSSPTSPVLSCGERSFAISSTADSPTRISPGTRRWLPTKPMLSTSPRSSATTPGRSSPRPSAWMPITPPALSFQIPRETYSTTTSSDTSTSL